MTPHKTRRLSALAASAACAIVAALTLTAAPASANAFGSTFFGPKLCTPTKPRLCQAAGTLNVNTSSVGGHGRRLNQMAASFVYRGAINDFWLDNDVFDQHGVTLSHCQGPYHGGYAGTYQRTCIFTAGSYLAPAGAHHCASLWRGSSTGPRLAARACNVIS